MYLLQKQFPNLYLIFLAIPYPFQDITVNLPHIRFYSKVVLEAQKIT